MSSIIMSSPPTGNIKSIQRGVLTILANETIKLISINEVDKSKSELKISILPNSNNTMIEEFNLKVHLYSNTVIRCERKKNDEEIVLSWELIEYKKVTVQRGDVKPGSFPVNINISKVDLEKAYITLGNFKADYNETSGAYFNQMGYTAELTSETNLQINGSYPRGRTFAWQVIEFK